MGFRRLIVPVAALAVAVAGVAATATARVSAHRDSAETPWAVVAQHVDLAQGDVTGLDVLRPGDRQAHALTRRPAGSRAWDNQPTWSPDGKRVAFARFYADEGLYVIDVSGGRPRRLSHDVVHSIVWSPDGTRIAFSRTCDRNVGTCKAATDAGVYVVDIRGGPPRRVFPAEGVAAWTPDGRQLACSCGGALWTLGADGSRRRRLGEPGDGRLGGASWSPDGTWIAYAARCAEGWNGPGGHDLYCDLAVVRPDGTDRRTLLRHGPARGPSDAAPFWSSSRNLLIPRWGFLNGIVAVDLAGAQRSFRTSTSNLWASRSRRVLAVLEPKRLVLLSPSGRVFGRVSLRVDSWGELDVHLG